MYEYKAVVTRVIDGDTFEANVDLGFKTYQRQTFRLKGVDTPEVYGTEEIRGLEAKDVVENMILGKEVIIETEKTGSFGRWIADVTVPRENGGINLGDLLIKNGLAEIYE